MADAEKDRNEAVEKQALAAPELARNRARSVATMIAAGLGAVIAGLVFTPRTVSLNHVAVVLCSACAVLLAISLSFFVGASMRTTRFIDQPNAVGRDVVSDAKKLVSEIRRRMVWGAWIGVLALVSLALIPPVQYLLGPSLTGVTMSLDPTYALRFTGMCPSLPETFSAQAPLGELRAGATTIPVRIDATTCGNPAYPSGLQLFVDTAQAQLVVVES